MKKIFTISVAALVVAASCSNATVEEKLQAYQEASKSIFETFKEQAKALSEDTNLAKEEATAQIEALSDKAESDVIALATKAIKKNADNEVAVAALKDVYYMMEPEELGKLLKSLKGDIVNNEFVQKVQKSVNAKTNTKEGEMFTDFTIVQDPENESESTVKFSDFVGKGKYVLVDFWASWCGPCKREIPNIKNVYEKYAGENFDVLSIAVWDKPEDTKASAIEHGVVWNQIINAQKIPTDIYGIDGIPHIMLIGPDGKILKRDLRGEAIEAEVAKYVSAK